jgi:RNA polymerase-binding transcription factor
MKKATIEKIKKNLEGRKDTIEKELATFTTKDEHTKDDYRANFPEFGDKEDENAKEIADYTDNLSVEHSLEKTLRDINKALEKIKKGKYGKCKYCNSDIPENRLMARPASSACVECKEKLMSQ